MSKVWLLGAGASAGSDQRLPLGKELVNAILNSDTWDWPSEEDRQRVCQFLNSFQQNAGTVDIEDCLTYLDCALSDIGIHTWQNLENFYAFRGLGWDSNVFTHDKPFTPSQELKRIKSILTQQLARILLSGSHELCEKHAQMFDTLKDADHIITLNYDLIVENTIQFFNMHRQPTHLPGKKTYKVYSDVEPGYDPKPKTEHVQRLQELLEERPYGLTRDRRTLAHRLIEFSFGSIYHLHGAINWFSCSDVSCPNHSQVMYAHDLAEIHMSRGHLCSCCGSLLEPVIIPPTMLKDYERFPKIRMMWQLASLALSSCSDLIIVGCSFRLSDFYLHHLIRSSLQRHRLDTITFVGQGSHAREALNRFLGFLPFSFSHDQIRLFDTGLDGYVSSAACEQN
jgi:hypothetical protein